MFLTDLLLYITDIVFSSVAINSWEASQKFKLWRTKYKDCWLQSICQPFHLMSFFTRRILHPSHLWLSWLEGSKVTSYQCPPQTMRYFTYILYLRVSIQNYANPDEVLVYGLFVITDLFLCSCHFEDDLRVP